MSVRLIIDSASDISKKEAEALGIIMLPMTITFDGTDYFDGVDLLPRRFYEMLIESDALPKTGQISPFRFKEAFEKHTQNGDFVQVVGNVRKRGAGGRKFRRKGLCNRQFECMRRRKATG